MIKKQLKSKIIMNVKKKLKHRDYKVLQEFWDNIEGEGTPLIEEIKGDIYNSLVTFVYRADDELENVVLVSPAGRNNLLENRFERLPETNLWYITCKVRNDVRFKYAFSINDSLEVECEKRWDNLKADKFNENKLIFKDEDRKEDEIESYVVMPNAREHFWVKERNSIPKGQVYEHEFYSEKLEKTRRIRIYTPYDYSKGGEPYKVLVLTDGEDYISVLSAVTVLDNLIADKKIPPIVAVFIDSTKTREEELSCNEVFGDFIASELVPWIKNNYNISKRAEDSIIGGVSMGGLTASYLGLKHSDIFGNVLSQSGSYWYKPEDYEGSEVDCWLSTQFKEIGKLPLKFYINVGLLEHKLGMIGTNIILRDVLISKGYTVVFEEFESGHDYLCWGETLANGLISLIGYR